MAVLLLMLPAADLARPSPGVNGARIGGAPRTYKLSLSANADLATIEVEGRPPTTTPVQRVYPTETPARAARVDGGAVARQVVAGAAPAAARPRQPPLAPPRDLSDAPLPLRESLALPEPRARASRRPATVMTSRAAAAPAFDPIVFASPNGAPIIE